MKASNYQWYVVQISPIKVDKLVENVRRILEIRNVADLVGEIFLPVVKYDAVNRKGKIESKQKLAYGGYMLINVASVENQSDKNKLEINPDVARALISCVGVLKILPHPLSEEEYVTMKENIQKQNDLAENDDKKISVGSKVTISSGSLKGFNGFIEKIVEDHSEKGTCYVVKVKIFDQETTIDCGEDEIRPSIEGE